MKDYLNTFKVKIDLTKDKKSKNLYKDLLTKLWYRTVRREGYGNFLGYIINDWKYYFNGNYILLDLLYVEECNIPKRIEGAEIIA